MEHLKETTYRGKNDHVTDDVTRLRKVKTQIHLVSIISKSFGDRVSVPAFYSYRPTGRPPTFGGHPLLQILITPTLEGCLKVKFWCIVYA